jgi:hypothetical protein
MILKGFKKCHISSAVDGDVRSVRKMEARSVKMKTDTDW